MFKFVGFFFITLTTAFFFVDGFAPPTPSVGYPTTTAATSTATQLWMSSSSSSQSSRRDVLTNTAAATAASLLLINPTTAQAFDISGTPVTPQSAANKANESYQGVYNDPKHPDGYRVIMAPNGDAKASNKATMELCDGGPKDGAKTFREIPVSVGNDGYELTFDFSFKNGPKNIKGTLSEDKQTITFEDGNTWTKNFYKYDGIYKVTKGGDPSLSKDAYRVIRRNKPEIIIEMNDTGNPKDSYYVDGAIGSLFAIPTCDVTFYFGGKNVAAEESLSFMDALYDFQRGGDGTGNKGNSPTKIGQLSLQDKNTVFPYGTITFPDKSVWTRM